MTDAEPCPGAASLDQALTDCIRHAEGEGTSLQDVLEHLGPASFCFVCVLLSVPFIQPFSLGPYTMASGVAFIAAGWQMMGGRETPLLPSRMRQLRIHGKVWVALLNICRRTVNFCRRFCRPRFEHWVTGKRGERVVGGMILAGGILLTIPMANLPLNNTFPALMILFAALAWLERDGLMLAVSAFWCAVTLVYFCLVGATAWMITSHVFAWFKGMFFP